MTDALSRLEQLDDDELDALVDIAQARASGAVSRRDLLKTGGALAALGVGGGAAVGSASADASTSDSDGNVGRPSDRYDGFFDGVDANSVSTEKLSNESGLTESQTELRSQTPIVENWERQSLAYWAGDTADLTFDTATVLEGTASVRTVNDSDNIIRSPFRALRGFKYRFYFRFDSGSSGTINMLVSQDQGIDISEGYQLTVSKSQESIDIRRRDGGSFAELASETGLTIPTDEWLVGEVSFEFGSITFDVSDISDTSVLTNPLTANDTIYQNDGWIQYFLSTNGSASGNHTYLDMLLRRPL